MHPRERIRFRTEALRAAGRWREPAERVQDGILVDTRSNDYLGLARQVVSRETLGGEGARLGAGASRLVSGTWGEHTDVEAALADWVGAETALLFSSAYAANVGCIAALAGPGELILSDALNHASIIDGCRLSKAEVMVLPHADCSALERALANTRGVRWVVVEAYFGMDGDSPDLVRIKALCDRFEAGLIVDEAHALGIFGLEGSGACAAAGVLPDVLVGGLGKAFGLQGGFAACSADLRGWLWNRARSFVFSTAPSPHLCALTLAQLKRVRAADEARARLKSLESAFAQRLVAAGVPVPAGRCGPIFPIVFGDESGVMRASEELIQRGVLCQPIRPPTVSPGGCRLRVTLRADMSEQDIALAASAIIETWSARASWAAPSGREAAPKREENGRTDVAAQAMTPTSLQAQAGCEPAQERAGGSSRAGSTAGSSARAREGRWVILGTGTGVGKTFVSRALLGLLRAADCACAGLKPIETGVASGSNAQNTDAAALQAASFHVKHPLPHPLYALPEPVTPSLAARNAGAFIDLTTIRAWAATAQIQTSDDPALNNDPSPSPEPHLVIETAGGVFSPITDTRSNFDLARALDPAAWILVAPNRLGVLHDVLSCLHAMAALGRRPDWIVLSAPENPDASTRTNADELRRHRLAAPILELPRNGADVLLPILQPHLPPAASTT